MKIIEFIRKAASHEVPTHRKDFWKGIFYAVGAWQLIALGALTHELATNTWLASLIDFSMQMLIATLLLFLFSIIYGFKQGDGLKGFRNLKITRKNEDIRYSHGRHLSYKSDIEQFQNAFFRFILVHHF